jgi:branched-chain amino acid transport system permease protein
MTGGIDGVFGVPYPNLGFHFSFSPMSYYYLALSVVAVSAFVLHRIVNSAFGVILQGIRENETRMECLGYNTWLYKIVAFAISGLFAGAAGILFVYYNGIVTPENVGFLASGVAILMIIIGGTGTLWGAVIGSAVFISLQYGISLVTPQRWPLILGICFIAVVMFMRGGILPRLRGIRLRAK